MTGSIVVSSEGELGCVRILAVPNQLWMFKPLNRSVRPEGVGVPGEIITAFETQCPHPVQVTSSKIPEKIVRTNDGTMLSLIEDDERPQESRIASFFHLSLSFSQGLVG